VHLAATTLLEIKKLDHVIHRMITYGGVGYVEAFLDFSEDRDIFLPGSGQNGDTMLVFASCERYPNDVKLLLKHGANPDRANSKGTTPLMEASL